MVKSGNQWRRVLLFWAIAGALFAGGCHDDRPEMVPVRGKVTLEGGAWPQPGMVDFTPIKPAEGFPSKAGSGHFDADGSFVVQTGTYEGLIPGTYSVAVTCWEKPPTDKKSGVSCLPKKFSNPLKSGLTLTIEPGQSGPIVWDHDFPRKKP
jgi:hypothetical protein